MKTVYEWCWNEMNEDGDITDNSFSDPGELDASPFGESGKLELVKSVWDDRDGELKSRSFASAEEGIISDTFDDGCSVPKKLQSEYFAFVARNPNPNGEA